MNGLFKSKNKIVGEVVMLNISELCPNKAQPRTEFGTEALASLAESIKENGILQPVCVRRKGALYEIISGERRMRAAKLIGLTEIPCIIMSVDDEQSAILALIENIQRKDLSFFEEALAIEKLITCHGLTQEEAAARLGKAQSTIANKLRLLRFTDSERRIILNGCLTERQARAVIRIDNVKMRQSVIDKIVREKLNIEQTELLVTQTLSGSIDQIEKKKKPVIKYKLPVKMYMNTLDALMKRIKTDNLPCEMSSSETEEFREYTIKFPIETAK